MKKEYKMKNSATVFSSGSSYLFLQTQQVNINIYFVNIYWMYSLTKKSHASIWQTHAYLNMAHFYVDFKCEEEKQVQKFEKQQTG